MTTNFASSVMGGGKSLYINHLRNLLVSISAFTVIAVMFFASSENVYSQCPPGFNGPYTTTIHVGQGCKVEIDYCLSIPSPSSGLCNIHITKQRFIGSNCYQFLPVDQNGNYGLPLEDIVSHITRLPVNYPCFDMINLDPCPQTSRAVILVSNGGCYYYIEGFTSEGEYIREYIPCDMSGVNYCYEYFSFCKEYIDGKWEIQVISGPPVQQFECLDEDCSSYCF